MTIGAVLLVKDEIDLVRRNLAYHSSIGVDCFVICDRGSTDESREQLEDLASGETVHLFRQDVYRMQGINAEVMAGVRLAALQEMRRVFAPDWVFPADSDELWVPRCGDLTGFVDDLAVDHLLVDRYNAALTRRAVPTLFDRLEGGDGLLEQEIIVGRRNLSADELDAGSATPWSFQALAAKFITAGTDLLEVDPGFHDVRRPGESRWRRWRRLRRPWATDLLILHLPFTTFDRFARKIGDIRTHVEHVGPSFARGQAWHWRRWASLEDGDDVRAEFDRQFFRANDLDDLRRRGIVMKIIDHFAARAGNGAPEARPVEERAG